MGWIIAILVILGILYCVQVANVIGNACNDDYRTKKDFIKALTPWRFITLFLEWYDNLE